MAAIADLRLPLPQHRCLVLKKRLVNLRPECDRALDHGLQRQGFVAHQRRVHRDDLADAAVDARIVHERTQPNLGI